LNPEIARAAQILRAGGLVAFPTETVYGLGADASSAAAVARLYAAKRRPPDHPVIVHFADAESAFAWAREVPEAARKLAARFWPGPLTLVLKRSPLAGDFVTGGQDTIGLRVPSHPVAQGLLREFKGESQGRRFSGVAAPSANPFGGISATASDHVDVQADLVLDGGQSEIGIESTIVDLSQANPAILRPGHVSAGEIEAAIGGTLSHKTAASPRHSGGLERHYAPRTPAQLVQSYELDAEIGKWKDRIAVLAFSRPDERVDFWLRMPKDPAAYAQRLYAALRELDGAACERILIEAPPESAEWAAVRDRLFRATA
jgi:L-threonylcarbamoyladenylate synthase